MKLRSLALLVFTASISLLVADSFFNAGYTRPTGAPEGACGSISHPATCAASGCHSGGSNAIQTGWITSGVPVSGYVPGTTYTITATATYTGRSTFGFQITPENLMGMRKGTLIATDPTHTQIVGTGSAAGNYITHTLAGNSGTTNFHTWTFGWTAPPVGTGDVTFFGAFLCANGDGHDTGDQTYKSSLALHEDITTGIKDNASGFSAVSVYPNPVSDILNVSYHVEQAGQVEVKLVDLTGRSVAALMSEIKTKGEYQRSFKIPFNLNSGIYFVEFTSETNNTVKRIFVQQ